MPDRLVGQSKPMVELKARLRACADQDSRVLLLGASGTGKEHCARILHDLSKRSKAPYVTLNCSAIPGSLFESELFGHEKGAFTGASNKQIGHIRRAEAGTLFLDEVGDLPLPSQAKLLRLLQEGTYTAVGGRETIKADVRFIAATNKNLLKAVEKGSFRRDLYHRLAILIITIPPLKDRFEDIPTLIKHYSSDLTWTQEALDALCTFSFPGNVRELINIIERVRAFHVTHVTVDDVNLALELDYTHSNDDDDISEYQKLNVLCNTSSANFSQIINSWESITQQLKSITTLLLESKIKRTGFVYNQYEHCDLPKLEIAPTEIALPVCKLQRVTHKDGRRGLVETISDDTVIIKLIGLSDLPYLPIEEDLWSLDDLVDEERDNVTNETF